jgi:hypothetical protein
VLDSLRLLEKVSPRFRLVISAFGIDDSSESEASSAISTFSRDTRSGAGSASTIDSDMMIVDHVKFEYEGGRI